MPIRNEKSDPDQYWLGLCQQCSDRAFYVPLHNLHIWAWLDPLKLLIQIILMISTTFILFVSIPNIKISMNFYCISPTTPKNPQSTMTTLLQISSKCPMKILSTIYLFSLWRGIIILPKLRLPLENAHALRPNAKRTTVSASSKELSVQALASAFLAAIRKNYFRQDLPQMG